MNYIFGNSKKTPAPTNLQTQKVKQIETLNQVNATVKEIIRFVEYRVIFVAGGATYTLIITLPSSFPEEKPTVCVDQPILHPWLNEQMQVTKCPALLNFSMHSNLGTAIQSIVDEFRRNVPRHPLHPSRSDPRSQPAHTYGCDMPYLSVPMSGFASSQTSSSGLRSTFFYPMPPVPSTFESINNLSMMQLNELMNDEDKLQELLDGLPEMKKIADDKREVTKICAELARENLSRKPIVEGLREELRSGIGELAGLQNRIDLGRHHFLDLSQQYSLSNILSNLKVSILEAEEESESIAARFLENKIEITEFCSSFLEIRSVCHSRRAKEEKLQQIMRSQGYSL